MQKKIIVILVALVLFVSATLTGNALAQQERSSEVELGNAVAQLVQDGDQITVTSVNCEGIRKAHEELHEVQGSPADDNPT